MKAILFQQHGGPEVLEYTEFPTPEPGPGGRGRTAEAGTRGR